MKAYSILRAHRRLSALVVALLIVFGTVSSLHHHSLAAPADGQVLGTLSGEDHPSRSLDCLVCRAMDAAPLVAQQSLVPDTLVAASAAIDPVSTPAPLLAPSSSPRAPPAHVA
jgi:hypothetical protein